MYLGKNDTSSKTPLHEAARAGHEAIVKLILSRDKTIINSETSENEYIYVTPGRTPLHEAADAGHEAIVTLLLDQGAGVDIKDSNGHTPLYRATTQRRESVIKTLLMRGAQADSHNKVLDTPLCRAAYNGYKPIVMLLLEYGASINHHNQSGSTPLHMAAAQGREEIVELLLLHGAKINPRDKRGKTPLHNAIEKDRREVVAKLLKKGMYNYKDEETNKYLSRFWKYEDNRFATILLLTGVRVPENIVLAEPLELKRRNIEVTFGEWLSEFNLSENEYQEVTPLVVGALPSLLRWCNQMKLAEEQRAAERSTPWEEKYSDVLEDLLQLASQGQEELAEDAKAMRNTLLNQFQNKPLPEELNLTIREHITRSVLAQLLKRCYDKLSSFPKVVDYLVAEVTSDPITCADFYEKLFQHDWKTPCRPPATPYMQRIHHKALCVLRQSGSL